jgi:hypothetical protein
MIEMLLALVILTGVVAAAASWTALSGRLGTLAVELNTRRMVVEAVFALIEDDLHTGDFSPTKREAKESPRMRVADRALEIDTREGCTHTYRLDPIAHRLERVDRSGQRSTTRPLVDDVVAFECAVDEERKILDVTVELRMRQGKVDDDEDTTDRFMRRYRVP